MAKKFSGNKCSSKQGKFLKLAMFFNQLKFTYFAQQIMPHDEFLKRIRKTLYISSPSVSNYQEISRPLAHYAAEIFSETHKGHSLNRLNNVTVANLNASSCSLIIAMIYLDRINDMDPMFARRITPTEMFLVSMVCSLIFLITYTPTFFSF